MFGNAMRAAGLMLLCTVSTPGETETLSPKLEAFRQIYQELVEINTTEFGRRHREGGRGDGGAAQARAAFLPPTSR